MAKIRKNVKRKTFQFNKNRKRMKKNDSKLVIPCTLIKKNWNKKRTTQKNMETMGLAFDVNKTIDNIVSKGKEDETVAVTVPLVANMLETEAKAPRARGYRLPRNTVNFLTELLDKYGEDYKKMALDKKNYGQLTWKQLRNKVKEFKRIPEQYNQFLEYRKDKQIDTTAVKTLMEDNDEW